MSEMDPKDAPVPPVRSRPCKKCGKDMPAARSVCAECGHWDTWFKLRLYVGCASLLLGGLAILGSIATALWGPGSN